MLFALAVLLLQAPQIPQSLTNQADHAATAVVETASATTPESSVKAPVVEPVAPARLNLREAQPFMNRASFRTRHDLEKFFGRSEPNPAPAPAFLPGQTAVSVETAPGEASSSSAAGATPRSTAVTSMPAPPPAFRVGRETRNSKRLWYVLMIAQHGAATFDAWSTRRVVESGSGRELNPFLRPFAGSNGLYAAVQVGPGVLDYLGKRMMRSQRGWVRRIWWVPQAAGTAASVASGVHNLGVYRRSP